MKIIFLDIDGVLNCGDTVDAAPSGAVGLDDELLDKLKMIVDATEAKIVLTSSWKTDFAKDASPKDAMDGFYAIEKLAKFGLSIYDLTPDCPNGTFYRGKEIRTWLMDKDVSSFVILDDYWFDFVECGLFEEGRVVLTEGAFGLTSIDAMRAIEILSKEV